MKIELTPDDLGKAPSVERITEVDDGEFVISATIPEGTSVTVRNDS